MRWRVALAGVLLAIGACTGGGTFVTGGGFSGASGGAAGSAGSGPIPSFPPEAGDPVEIPFVACSLEPVDAAADAESSDAESSDADSPRDPEDAGLDESPCATPPPPECVGQTSMVVFSSEGCDGERCIFVPSFIGCPGGCFRQMDGGQRCNE